MTISNPFTEYLKKVIESPVRIRRKLLDLKRVIKAVEDNKPFEEGSALDDFEAWELIDHLTEREKKQEVLKQFLYKYSIDEIMDILKYQYIDEDILDELDEDDMVEYLTDKNYFVADNEDDAVKQLKDDGWVEVPFGKDNPRLPNFRKQDCIEILEKITEKEGWNDIYDILLVEKNRLHII